MHVFPSFSVLYFSLFYTHTLYPSISFHCICVVVVVVFFLFLFVFVFVLFVVVFWGMDLFLAGGGVVYLFIYSTFRVTAQRKQHNSLFLYTNVPSLR